MTFAANSLSWTSSRAASSWKLKPATIMMYVSPLGTIATWIPILWFASTSTTHICMISVAVLLSTALVPPTRLSGLVASAMKSLLLRPRRPPASMHSVALCSRLIQQPLLPPTVTSVACETHQSGAYYQFRATSSKNQCQLSRTEDLRGVFYLR